MLSKTSRISRQKDFDYIFKNGRSYRGRFMTVKVAPNINDVSRFAVIVSKRISTKAIIRNLAKRRIKSVIESLLPRFSGKFSLVIILNKFSKEMPFTELARDLEEILIHAKIIKKNV